MEVWIYAIGGVAVGALMGYLWTARRLAALKATSVAQQEAALHREAMLRRQADDELARQRQHATERLQAQQRA